MQKDAPSEAGYEKIFTEQMRVVASEKPGIEMASGGKAEGV